MDEFCYSSVSSDLFAILFIVFVYKFICRSLCGLQMLLGCHLTEVENSKISKIGKIVNFMFGSSARLRLNDQALESLLEWFMNSTFHYATKYLYDIPINLKKEENFKHSRNPYLIFLLTNVFILEKSF